MIRALLLLLLLAAPARAQGPTLAAALRAGLWAEADALAAALPDPLARKLVLHARLQAPGAARAPEIASFMAANPDWPNQALLSRRLQEALTIDRDDRAVLEICRATPPALVPSLLRCADTEARAPIPEPEAARRAWVAGIIDAPGEAAFVRRWALQLRPEDQWRRFDRLAWSDTPAPGGPAARQAVRVAPAQRPWAEARLALKRDDPTAPALAATLGPLAADPTLVLELARWYRRAGQDRDAARVWTGPGAAAEQAAPPDRQQAFWDERNLLARRLLRANEPALAASIVAAQAAAREATLDQAFLAGWIALRRTNQPEIAAVHFQRLATLSSAALTQSRAAYWLGRAQQAQGADPAPAFTTAAAWPTTYYGQLAALALGDDAEALARRIAAASDPAWDEPAAAAFLEREPARAAVLLAAWGEPRRARPFLARLDETAATPTERALAARLALGLGLPDQAVAIARRAGRDGVMLPIAGWPLPVEPPPGLEPAIVLALIRQESSFDIAAQSPVGARGLMQLMPATAASVARGLGVPADLAALTTDADYNMRLGTTYLQGLVTQFGALPLALAGYNAGPKRVQDWLVAAPADLSGPEMIDWIELIPFNETRNYVQRVIENVLIYRAKLGRRAPHPTVRF